VAKQESLLEKINLDLCLKSEESHYIPKLGLDHIFPNPRFASDYGLVAYGGDLNPNRILSAYRYGIFPWYSENDPILWWSPNPRLVLLPTEFKTTKSFKKILKNGRFEVYFDRDFKTVIEHCANIYREGQNGTWIIDEMQEAYLQLHYMGFAHSIETYLDGELVGGLYGIDMGSGFYGESMFSLVNNASKVALRALSDVLAKKGYDFIDCQVETPHLISVGAKLIDRNIFLNLVEESLEKSGLGNSWQNTIWKYQGE